MSSSSEEQLRRYRLLAQYIDDGVPLVSLAAQEGVSARTLQRWLQNFKAEGLQGLSKQDRKDKACRRAVSAELQLLIEGLYLTRPKPSIAAVHRRVSRICLSQGWEAPSYSTIYDIVKELPPGMVTLAHEGAKVYKELFDLVLRREADCPNDIWQADHTELDILLVNDLGEPGRPWLTVILDDFSLAFAGYLITFDPPKAINTALALHQAISPKNDLQWSVCGIPEQFYTDHGSDFTSNHLEQVSHDLKMSAIFSAVGQPRGRGKQERFFRTIYQLFLCELPGYLAPDVRKPKPVLTLE